jgi:hypothetical protein
VTTHVRATGERAADEQTPARFDVTSPAARAGQLVLAVVLCAVSLFLLIPLHRFSIDLGGAHLPVGLLFALVFQVVVSVFLWAATGAYLPVIVLACLWGLGVMPFAGNGAGGGVLMPAALGDRIQLQGWVIQAIGVLVPFAVLLVVRWRERRTP